MSRLTPAPRIDKRARLGPLGRLLTALTSTALVAGALVLAPAPALAYNPKPGPSLNSPLAAKRAEQRVNLRKINGAIDNAVPGSQIRISSWNLRNGYAVKALTKAHRRGVSVRVLIDGGNASKELPNRNFKVLKKRLRKGNLGRTAETRSWAKRCASSCRGRSGITHTKFYLFSQTGAASNLVMYGSANLTDLASTHQWNDLYTTVGDAQLYAFMNNIFTESSWDRRQVQPYRIGTFPGLALTIWPATGPGSIPNPVLDTLNRVTCAGAAPGTGNRRGATSIRIAITATLGQTGVEIAQRLHQLWSQGCDIKIIYAVMGNNVLDVLRAKGPRGGVPLRQVVQDFDHDGVYDRYLHTKFMTISGNYNGNPATELTANGSANWTPVALVSDETYAHVPGLETRRYYSKFVKYWFNNAPYSYSYRSSKTSVNRMAGPGGTPGSEPVGPAYGRLVKGVNPYAKVQVN